MICGFCKVDKPRSEFGAAPPRPHYNKWCRACERNRASVRKHGVTAEQKVQIAGYNCGCAICGHPTPGGRGWVVDHDHECCDGQKSCPTCRRGILCVYCNAVLGNAFDRIEILQSAIDYLKDHASGICEWHRPVACSERICGKLDAA